MRTEYVNETAGSTSLHFAQLTRRDKGVYTVIIDNNMTLLLSESSVRTNFFINVEGNEEQTTSLAPLTLHFFFFLVLPSRPTPPVFMTFNSTLSKIVWTLTNTTVDDRPEAIIVNIEDHPLSPINLAPSQTHVLVETEPGVTYIVTIVAFNVDGSATSQPSHLVLPSECKSITV